MAITSTDVNETQKFRSTPLIDKPVPTFRPSPKVRPNPFTGLPQVGTYEREHNVVNEPPDTVLEATKSNPID